MKVLIVDDEPPARQRLRRLLAAHDDVDVVGEAGDAAQALAQCAALTPDAVLLDIRMPGTDGLDLAASLPDPRPGVVFVTAHDGHALAAFEAAALDYLLKPVDPERLARALQRLRTRAPAALDPPPPERLLIPDRQRLHVVAVQDILWLEAADNYVQVHTAQGAPLLRRTLASLLGSLGPGFLQTHRSAAVALAQVLDVKLQDGGEALVRLRDGTEVRCARQRRAELMRRLAWPPATDGRA
ncbi:MAG: LytR/AlgR family response regulator transcription factor [Rubrivivax sp.]